MCKDKSDRFFKWAFLVLLTIAVAVYAFDCRYRDVEMYISGGPKSVLLDAWTNDVVIIIEKEEGVARERYEIGKIRGGSLYEQQAPKPDASFLNLATPKSNTRKLYGRLLYLGVDCGTFEEMEEAIQRDERNRQWLYDICVEKGINVGSYKQFKKSLGLP